MHQKLKGLVPDRIQRPAFHGSSAFHLSLEPDPALGAKYEFCFDEDFGQNNSTKLQILTSRMDH